MKGYLLDTNVISDWLDATKPRHAAVSKKAEEAAQAQAVMVTSSVVLGEIEYGIAAVGTRDQKPFADLRDQVIKQFAERRLLLSVAKSTTPIYGELKAKLFEKFAPNSGKKLQRPEQLVNPITSRELGIQENDLWIAAQAIERNLVLVTNDAMARIQEVASELKVEDWAASS